MFAKRTYTFFTFVLNDNAGTDYIADDALLVNKYVAKDASATCAAFVAGIVQGVLDAGAFVCCIFIMLCKFCMFIVFLLD